MIEGKDVTWFPSYGAEIRGGTANCTVIISDEMIGSPVVMSPDILIVMNRASLDRFSPRLGKKGLLFYDSSFIPERITKKDIIAIPVPATEMASTSGNTKSANMVMLGAFLSKTKLIEPKTIAGLFGGSADNGNAIFRANKDLVQKGIDFIENSQGAYHRY